ncbi:kunitz-type serine protease inhibitor homolog dendrotoxin I-like [Drosophila grimshawi]|uniref:kunitz-type serine protease inhibitor homolog dendrotoxin I-like n=1 Tax=Drosophila grimshawi TaxID=7222 RepID=UPI0013EF157F|nr:kunitz-type serine protease inhibitor homolog dendrotoxin I-like [Drosophila grimshawi]
MKFILILACLALFVAHTQAQNCRGSVTPPLRVCVGPRDEGNTFLPHCGLNRNPNMWWYDSSDRTCRVLNFRGCGGNRNRFCTREQCRTRCLR